MPVLFVIFPLLRAQIAIAVHEPDHAGDFVSYLSSCHTSKVGHSAKVRLYGPFEKKCNIALCEEFSDTTAEE